MSQRTVTDCDKCGKESNNPIHVSIPNGKYVDSASPSLDVYYDYITKDLCHDCCQNLLKRMLESVREVNSEGIRYFRRRALIPNPTNNDAVGIALEYFGITPKT